MLPDAPEQPQLPIFLRNRHWVDFRRKKPDPLEQLIWGITGQKPTTVLKTAESISISNVAVENFPSSAVPDRGEGEKELSKAPEQPVSTTSSRTPVEDELTSAAGVDYTRL